MQISEIAMTFRLIERLLPLIFDLWEGRRDTITRQDMIRASMRADDAEAELHRRLKTEGEESDGDAEKTG